MGAAPDDRERIKADLLTWARQQEGRVPEWYLDEGSATGAETASPDAGTAASPAAQPPAAAPATTTGDPAFDESCSQFLADTLALVARYGEGSAEALEPDALLAEHAGDKAAALDALRAVVTPCTACPLHEKRTNTVFGSGNPDADVVFIGEAPGRDEDLQGEPFVGRSGQLLTKILGAIGYARDDVFICNILKCRPPNNRDPQGAEVEKCEPHLKRQLSILQPRVICCLGRVAAQTLLGTDTSLKRLRSAVHFYAGIPVMATYHPAALLRNPSWKRDTWNDVRKLQALAEALRTRGG